VSTSVPICLWSSRPEPQATIPPTETGSLTAFVAVVSLALFILIGLVVDTGRAIAARSLAMDQAQQAARAGAGQLSIASLRLDQVEIDPSKAILAANSYLSSVGQTGTISVVGQVVTVHIDSQDPTVILGIVGVNRIAISVTARATNVHGVTQED
jgi:Flp pilus assembly protein TadG